jgi:hypothetical protein
LRAAGPRNRRVRSSGDSLYGAREAGLSWAARRAQGPPVYDFGLGEAKGMLDPTPRSVPHSRRNASGAPSSRFSLGAEENRAKGSRELRAVSELRAHLVTPLSGPLARFGRAGAVALRLWAAEAADLPHLWRRVRLDLHDAYPDPAAAMQNGSASQPHLVFGPYGSHPSLRRTIRSY